MGFHETFKTKICAKCGESKVISVFVKPYGEKVAESKYCLDCRQILSIESKDRERKSNADRLEKNRAKRKQEWALMLKSGEAFVCSRCKKHKLIKYKTSNGVCTRCVKQIIENKEHNDMINSAIERKKIIEKKWSMSQREKAEAENKEQDMIANFLKNKKD